MASDSPTQSLLSYTHTYIYTYTRTLPVTHWAQWEVPAKRAAIVRMRVLVFSQEIYSCLKQPAPFFLNHDTMDMLKRSSTWDKSSKMGFLLYVVIWLWTVLHTEVMTTQSTGISPMCRTSRTKILCQKLVKPSQTIYYLKVNICSSLKKWLPFEKQLMYLTWFTQPRGHQRREQIFEPPFCGDHFKGRLFCWHWATEALPISCWRPQQSP